MNFVKDLSIFFIEHIHWLPLMVGVFFLVVSSFQYEKVLKVESVLVIDFRLEILFIEPLFC